jgi:hypothetical protein
MKNDKEHEPVIGGPRLCGRDSGDWMQRRRPKNRLILHDPWRSLRGGVCRSGGRFIINAFYTDRCGNLEAERPRRRILFIPRHYYHLHGLVRLSCAPKELKKVKKPMSGCFRFFGRPRRINTALLREVIPDIPNTLPTTSTSRSTPGSPEWLPVDLSRCVI